MRSRDLETGEVRWARIKATAVHDPDGGVRLAINVIEDITELKRSEEAQRFLAEASRRLSGSSLDYERTLAAVGELAVPALADALRRRPGRGATGCRAEVAEVMRTGAAWLEPSRDDRADDLRARDRDADADAATGASSTPPTCSWPRTSGCARAPRWRTRGSIAPPR